MTLIENMKRELAVPEELMDKELASMGASWHQLARGDLSISFADLQLALICNNHSLWCQAFLKEPDTGEPYVYWPYQLKSADCKGDKIHEDAAEVGKTREIGNTILHHAFTRKGGSSLIGAPEQVHLDEIIEYCIEQMFVLNTVLGKSLRKHKKHPHHCFYFKNGYKVYFSPGGFDGTGFRGKHVSDLCIMDEAAKIKNPAIWSEFFRSAKPSAVFGIYSVPDGDRNTVFHRLAKKAKGVKEQEKDGIAAIDVVRGRNFNYFHWKKTDQPYPFWSVQRRREYIDLYGGEDSPGYKRNVLGEDGDPENAVFPWHQFSMCLKGGSEYMVLKLLVDEGSKSVSMFTARYSEVNDKDGSREGHEEIIEDRTISRGEFDVREIIKRVFSPMPGLKYLGGDLGFSNDPTELIVRLVIGKTDRVLARVHLKGITYDMQDEAIDALDDVFEFKGIGLDYGNAGSAVVHNLQSDKYPDKHYDERVTGYQFSEAYNDIDVDGNVLIDKKTNKPKRLPAKVLATSLMTKKVQRQEKEFPFDPDYINQFASHTAREGSRHVIYSKGNDHIIDAERVLTLKMMLPDNTCVDIFSSDVSHRVA